MFDTVQPTCESWIVTTCDFSLFSGVFFCWFDCQKYASNKDDFPFFLKQGVVYTFHGLVLRSECFIFISFIKVSAYKTHTWCLYTTAISIKWIIFRLLVCSNQSLVTLIYFGYVPVATLTTIDFINMFRKEHRKRHTFKKKKISSFFCLASDF